MSFHGEPSDQGIHCQVRAHWGILFYGEPPIHLEIYLCITLLIKEFILMCALFPVAPVHLIKDELHSISELLFCFLYPRHMKYVEGYVVFIFPSIGSSQSTKRVNILCQSFAFFPFAYTFESLHFRL